MSIEAMETRRVRIRIVHGLALLSTGLLAGAFGYGAANLVPTFDAVPLDMRLSFHSELMKVNGITVQGAMGASILTSGTLAVLTRGRERVLAGTAGLLAVASFLITRFGNVPINGRIKKWAVGSPPPDYADILARWEMFNILRTSTATVAFALLIFLALRPGSVRQAPTKSRAEEPVTAAAR
ncbi:anthrone oxygenase family protein [Streptomyces sp. NPDC051018]|uniref:anthrone oxygenase family protein n=1 Tax=Streptomyces sp. NPDC051018 TaxID=3365639 RepID=UPI00378A25C3